MPATLPLLQKVASKTPLPLPLILTPLFFDATFFKSGKEAKWQKWLIFHFIKVEKEVKKSYKI
jgi:hypothetical protein